MPLKPKAYDNMLNKDLCIETVRTMDDDLFYMHMLNKLLFFFCI